MIISVLVFAGCMFIGAGVTVWVVALLRDRELTKLRRARAGKVSELWRENR